MMMIPAGKPVDATIEKLLPLLDRGDVVIDGGNSWFEDSDAVKRRSAEPAFISSVVVCRGAKRARASVRP